MNYPKSDGKVRRRNRSIHVYTDTVHILYVTCIYIRGILEQNFYSLSRLDPIRAHQEETSECTMKIDKKTIDWVADLARIDLSDEEESEMAAQLARILDYMDVLNELDLSKIEPTAHALGYTNVMRVDEEGESFDVEVVHKLAPQWGDDHVIVPRIV